MGKFIRAVVAMGVAIPGLLVAADEQKVQVSKTERVDFAAGGTLHLKNSTGVLNIEGWDQPQIEITTIRSSRNDYPAAEREKVLGELEKVRVATERHGSEFVITTTFPRHTFPLPDFLRGENSFDLEYRIKVPVNTRLVVEHYIGEINVDNLSGDIDARLREGEILLRLPQQGVYAIQAKSNLGSVESDYPGGEKSRPWPFGHRLSAGAEAPHRLNLQVGFGDILILKALTPRQPAPLVSGQ